MNLKHCSLSFVLLLTVTGCVNEEGIERTFTLENLHYENFKNTELSFELVDSIDTEISIKGTSSSCGETKIENVDTLSLFVDFRDIHEGIGQEFPLYVKYGDTVCEFEVSPQTVTFDVAVKE